MNVICTIFRSTPINIEETKLIHIQNVFGGNSCQGESKLMFCYKGSRENHFGRSANNQDPKFQGRLI